jgi:hypothetical protein
MTGYALCEIVRKTCNSIKFCDFTEKIYKTSFVKLNQEHVFIFENYFTKCFYNFREL